MAIEAALKRTFNISVLILVAAAAYFQARGGTQLLSVRLGYKDRKSPRDQHTSSPALVGGTKSAQAILDRNPFDSATGRLPRSPRPVNSAANLDASDPLSWPECEGIHVLIVTESKDPHWSLATLQAADEPRPRLRRIGDDMGGRQVAFIGYNPKQQAPSVWFEGGNALCQSVMFQRAAPELAPVPTLASAPAIAHLRASEIPRYQASIMRQVRVVPELKNGAIVGIKLFGIGAGSLLDSLGLRNGDRLDSINGFEIATPEKALQAYAQLRTAGHLHVLLTRSGKALAIDLNIS